MPWSASRDEAFRIAAAPSSAGRVCGLGLAAAFNPLYRGQVVWGRVRKRDPWGLKKYLDRPETEW